MDTIYSRKRFKIGIKYKILISILLIIILIVVTLNNVIYPLFSKKCIYKAQVLVTQIANGETVGNLNLGDVVTARLTDGTNHGDSASITVADKKEPTAGITVGTVTRDSITVTATGTDAESGVKNYTFEYKLSTSNSYTGTTKKATTSHTFEGLTAGQTYNIKVTVTDNAGNTKEATTTGATLAPTPTPTPGKDDLWDPNLGSTPTPTPGKDDLWDPDLGSTPTPTPGKDDLWDPDLGSTPTPTPGKDDLWESD